MTDPALVPQVGQLVNVRSRRYLVEAVNEPPVPGQSALIDLACVDDDAQGQLQTVLWQNELDAKVLDIEGWADLGKRGFDTAEMFSAYMHALRWNCVTATDPKLLQAPFRAGIQIHAYQLEPLRKALLLPRVNLFIADDVGLGKTIEAGLIIRELLLRKKIRDIVVAAPPSVLLQWKDELETRFGLNFVVLDREYLGRIRQQQGYGTNPWNSHTRFLISHRLLIDEEYAAPLRDWLGELRTGSLLVLDEAHVAAPSSGAKYAIDSKITRAVRDLADRFEHRVFLSATPHNGHSNSFSALLEILDPQRFVRGVPVAGKRTLDAVMVRRLKDDIREVEGGFPRRETPMVLIKDLPKDAPELLLSRLLNEYRTTRQQRLKGESKRRKATSGLLVVNLQQRLLSSIEAFLRTLKVHRKTVERHWKEWNEAQPDEVMSARQTKLLLDSPEADDEEAEIDEAELEAEEEALVERASKASIGTTASPEAKKLFAREQELLEQMEEVASANAHKPDARVRELIAWIRTNMCADLGKPGAKWNNTRVLIFTEWDDTKRYMREQLETAIAGTDQAEDRIEVYHGPTPPYKREHIKRAFNTDPAKHPLRILIATDAAREGVNLQNHCSNLFHFDLPWNPSRLEQRNGRIDRKLQRADVVNCHYFYYAQRPEDKVLKVLVAKTKTIKQELGSLSKVIETKIHERLRGGISHDEADKLAGEIETADLEKSRKQAVAEELEEVRERQDELRGNIDKLRNLITDSRKWLGLETDHFKAAINASLKLLNADAIKQTKVDPSLPQAFAIPSLHERDGADASWVETMDALRVPRKPDQKPWEWRRDNPVRPIVFDAPEQMSEDVIHLHLEHRLVQRLLNIFTSQGFVYHDLSRACLAHSKDSIPRVALIGRLALYGTNAARLHEEIVAVTARWQEPDRRGVGLKPYGRDSEEKTIELIEEALLPSNGKAVPQPVQKQLIDTTRQDIQELLPHLEERAEKLKAAALKKLGERAGKEATEMQRILEDQRRRILAAAKRVDEDKQTYLQWDDTERRQLDLDRKAWDKRLSRIDTELETEPARVRDVYEVRASRLEPVGLVYLWPVTG